MCMKNDHLRYQIDIIRGTRSSHVRIYASTQRGFSLATGFGEVSKSIKQGTHWHPFSFSIELLFRDGTFVLRKVEQKSNNK